MEIIKIILTALLSVVLVLGKQYALTFFRFLTFFVSCCTYEIAGRKGLYNLKKWQKAL